MRGGRQDFLYSTAHVLGGAGPRHAPGEQALPPGAARSAGTRRATRSRRHHHAISGTPRAGLRAASRARRPGRVGAAHAVGQVHQSRPTRAWLSTLDGHRPQELVERRLVYRYDRGAAPGRPAGGEGTFSMCSFWYVECLARGRRRLDEARLIFEKMLGYANHLGLYAEETRPARRAPRQLPAGLHPPGAHQRGLRPGPRPIREGTALDGQGSSRLNRDAGPRLAISTDATADPVASRCSVWNSLPSTAWSRITAPTLAEVVTMAIRWPSFSPRATCRCAPPSDDRATTTVSSACSKSDALLAASPTMHHRKHGGVGGAAHFETMKHKQPVNRHSRDQITTVV